MDISRALELLNNVGSAVSRLNWVTLLSAFGGAAGGAFLAHFVIPEFIMNPRLTIELTGEFDSVLGSTGDKLHHRLLVTNRGRTSATHCQAFITISGLAQHHIWEPPGEMGAVPELVPRLRPRDFANRNPLEQPAHTCWALENRVELTLIRDVPYAVNILRTRRLRSGQLVIEVCSEQGWETPRVLLNPGDYTFRVWVAAANCKPSIKVPFRIQITGDDRHISPLRVN